MLDIPVLESERLVLRPWKATSDAPGLFAYASLEEATQYMLFDTHRSTADTHEFLARAATSPERGYAITLRGDDRPIGGCGINPTPAHRRAEIGYILHPEHWGMGLATEAAARLIQHGFEDLGLNRIYARADTRNPASRRVMEKAGMTCEGTLREDLVVRNVPRSFFICSILRSEWLVGLEVGAGEASECDQA
ncbi:MAG: GNAT family N-acetyltransferase [Armatimonadetes bacterium]|nr:GNAT family N-acetyltransferase [Armatimonadota bacterium]